MLGGRLQTSKASFNIILTMALFSLYSSLNVAYELNSAWET